MQNKATAVKPVIDIGEGMEVYEWDWTMHLCKGFESQVKDL